MRINFSGVNLVWLTLRIVITSLTLRFVLFHYRVFTNPEIETTSTLIVITAILLTVFIADLFLVAFYVRRLVGKEILKNTFVAYVRGYEWKYFYLSDQIRKHEKEKEELLKEFAKAVGGKTEEKILALLSQQGSNKVNWLVKQTMDRINVLAEQMKGLILEAFEVGCHDELEYDIKNLDEQTVKESEKKVLKAKEVIRKAEHLLVGKDDLDPTERLSLARLLLEEEDIAQKKEKVFDSFEARIALADDSHKESLSANLANLRELEFDKRDYRKAYYRLNAALEEMGL